VDSAKGQAWIRFNRQERHNTVTPLMVEEMYDVLSRLGARDDLQVVALTGVGRFFCPGADLDHQPGQESRPPAREAFLSAALLVEMPQVTVAAVNGGCAGAGFAWAMACDLRLASSGARFSPAFIDAGLAGEFGLAWTLQRQVGTARARDLMLLPRKFDADQMRALGLVTEVYNEATFSRDAEAFVSMLATLDRQALRTVKANLLDAERLPLRDYIDIETTRHMAEFSGEAAEDTYGRLHARSRALRSS
jgi:2-(1,2-epoxy-1,2-dihydrophenyl)acetyl-CoA isomerase